jgi:hypothetical protein
MAIMAMAAKISGSMASMYQLIRSKNNNHIIMAKALSMATSA